MENLTAFLAAQMWTAADAYSVQHLPKTVAAPETAPMPERRRSANIH